MDLGDLISLYRKEAGLTIDELSEKSGVPKGTLNKIIGGITKAPTLDNMKAIAHALGKKLADFDEESDELFTFREQTIIKKYRALDEPGKETVDYILDKELSRTKALEAAQKVVQLPEPQKPVEYVKLDIASRGGGIETRLVPKEDVEKAIELSRKYRDENKD